MLLLGKKMDSYAFSPGERPFTVGERVRDAKTGHVATVRYIGTVASAKDQVWGPQDTPLSWLPR